MNIDKLHERCEEVYTKQARRLCAAEECSELSAALCRYEIGKATVEEVLAEVADVELMLEALRRMFGQEAAGIALQKKIARLEKRLESFK